MKLETHSLYRQKLEPEPVRVPLEATPNIFRCCLIIPDMLQLIFNLRSQEIKEKNYVVRRNEENRSNIYT